MSEPVTISVKSDYIQGEPDMQMRLFVRNLINQYHELDDTEKIIILNDEVTRLERKIATAASHTVEKGSPDL